MKRTVAFLIVAVLILSFLCPAAMAMEMRSAGTRSLPDYSHIRVNLCSLGTDLKSISLYASGRYNLRETDDVFSDRDLKIALSDGSLELSYAGTVKYIGKEINLIRSSVDPSAGYIKLPNDRKYLGDFRFCVKTSGGKSYIQIINTVPTVYYLYGVLKGEMGNDTPQDALKAQSLSAKSYVLSRMDVKNEYDVGDTSVTQVYHGYDSSWNNIISAVNSTANEVVFLGDEIMYTLYASSNGGETDIPSHAWGSGCTHLNPGYTVAIDQYDFDSTGIRETLTIRLGEPCDNMNLGALLMLYARKQDENVTNIVGIDNVEMNSPKFDGVERNMTNAHFEIRAESDNTCFAMSLDIPSEELLNHKVFTKSSLRTYWGEKTGTNTYNIYHARYGHGVGLSQRAAKYRAMLGQDYKEILSFYFPGSHVGTISSISDSLNDNSQNTPLPGSDKLSGAVHRPLNEITSIIMQNTNENMTAPGAMHFFGRRVECYAYTNVHGAYMYAAASQNSTVINRLPYGEMLLVLGTEGEWVYVQTVNGMTGYVPSGVLVFVSKTPQSVTYRLGKVTTDDVNFRSEPSTSSVSLGKLAKNTQLYIWGSVSNSIEWYYVQNGLTYGYVSAQYVNATGSYTANDIAEGSVIASGITKSNVNLRPAPTTNNNPITQLQSGTYLLIYSLKNGWYSVHADGRDGYVSESYVTLSTALPIPPADVPSSPVEPQPIGTGTINATNVRFRSTPDTSTSQNIIALLQRGDKLTLFSLSGGWYYASYEGQKGYVAEQYVDVTPTTPPEVTEGELHLTKGETTGSVNFREGAGTSYAVYKQLAKGTKFEIIGEHDSWYFIRVDGICGFITKQYAKITEEGNVGIITVAKDWKSYTTKAKGDCNLRLGASVLYSVIDVIEKGDSVTVLAITGEWCLVQYNGILGYCSHDYLEK